MQNPTPARLKARAPWGWVVKITEPEGEVGGAEVTCEERSDELWGLVYCIEQH